MSEREASVKLTLDDGQYAAAMRKVGDLTEKAIQKGNDALKIFGGELAKAKVAWGAMGTAARTALAGSVGPGLTKVKKDLGELAGHAKKAIGIITGLAGGFTVAGAVQGAVELDHKFKDLSDRVTLANGSFTSFSEIQRVAEQAAAGSGRRTAEMAEAFDDLFKATGDSKFAADVLASVGIAATATGQSVGTLASLADQMHTKFGVAAADMGDVFAQVQEAAQKGGPSFEEFAGVASNVGAELIAAGIGGRKGLDFMLGALIQTDDPMKNLMAQTKGIKQILMSLGDSKQISELAKGLHIDPKSLLNEKDLMARMRKVLSHGTKGLDALKGSMKENEEKKALAVLFTDPFEKALADANASGLKGKAAIDAALAELDKQINNFGKATIHGTDLQKKAAEKMREPKARLDAALETLERSFAAPEILDAITDLSQYLPQLASAFGKFAKFVATNPLLSAALGIGGRAGLSFMQGAIGELIKGHTIGGKVAGKEVEGALVTGGGKMASAIRLAGIAAAAAMAYEIGKEAIDNALKSDAQTTGDLSAAEAGAAGSGGSIAQQQAQAATLRAAIAKKKADMGGVITSGLGSLAGGTGSEADLDPMGNPMGTSSSGLNLNDQATKQLQEAEHTLQIKEARIAALIAAASNPAPAAKAAAPVDAKAVGTAIAETLKSSRTPLLVQLQGMYGGSSGGGSRGPTMPRPARAGGGH